MRFFSIFKSALGFYEIEFARMRLRVHYVITRIVYTFAAESQKRHVEGVDSLLTLEVFKCIQNSKAVVVAVITLCVM